MVLSSAETSSKVFLVVAPVAQGDFGTHCSPRAVLWLGLFTFLGSIGSYVVRLQSWLMTVADVERDHR